MTKRRTPEAPNHEECRACASPVSRHSAEQLRLCRVCIEATEAVRESEAELRSASATPVVLGDNGLPIARPVTCSRCEAKTPGQHAAVYCQDCIRVNDMQRRELAKLRAEQRSSNPRLECRLCEKAPATICVACGDRTGSAWNDAIEQCAVFLETANVVPGTPVQWAAHLRLLKTSASTPKASDDWELGTHPETVRRREEAKRSSEAQSGKHVFPMPDAARCDGCKGVAQVELAVRRSGYSAGTGFAHADDCPKTMCPHGVKWADWAECEACDDE